MLGRFGVCQKGSICRVTALDEKIGYGSITAQGLSFYGGNFIYETEIEGCDKEIWLQIPKYRGALLRIMLDGEDKGTIAFSPYMLYLGRLQKGSHRLLITCYGNRYNTFGMLHNADPCTKWFGPDAWRSQGVRWCDEYCLKDTGILSAPILWQRESC